MWFSAVRNLGFFASDTKVMPYGIDTDIIDTAPLLAEYEQLLYKVRNLSVARLTYNLGIIMLLQLIAIGIAESNNVPMLWVTAR
jgi:hypothetical protein